MPQLPARRLGVGATLGYSLTNGSFTLLAGIISGQEGESKTDVVDVTGQTDTFKLYLPGQIDPGEWSFDIIYDPADTATTKILNDAFYNKTFYYWQLTYPTSPLGASGTPTEVLYGFVSSHSRDVKNSDQIQAKITIQLSGDPGFTQ